MHTILLDVQFYYVTMKLTQNLLANETVVNFAAYADFGEKHCSFCVTDGYSNA